MDFELIFFLFGKQAKILSFKLNVIDIGLWEVLKKVSKTCEFVFTKIIFHKQYTKIRNGKKATTFQTKALGTNNFLSNNNMMCLCTTNLHWAHKQRQQTTLQVH